MDDGRIEQKDYEFEEGDRFTPAGSGVEYEVVSRVIPPNLGVPHYVIARKDQLDEMDETRVKAPEPTEEEPNA